MYKKQIGQQILFLLSVFLCSYFFVRVDSLQCLKTNYARAWHCNCLHKSVGEFIGRPPLTAQYLC